MVIDTGLPVIEQDNKRTIPYKEKTPLGVALTHAFNPLAVHVLIRKYMTAVEVSKSLHPLILSVSLYFAINHVLIH